MMLTILEVINLSAGYLEKKGIEDPKRNAELLLCKTLNCKKLNLYLNFDRPLSEDELADYRELIRRRGEREPLQYITGKVEFYGLEFKVNKDVLIPRPETEILVEKIIKENAERNCSILDVGTGSGNIAVSLAVNLPAAEITAVDKSSCALKVASENASGNNCSERIKFILADIFSDNTVFSGKFDIIVSNPPYIAEKEFPQLQPELRIYEPKAALSDYSDGLSFYRRIIEIANTMLNDYGTIYFEMGQGQSSDIKNILLQNGYSNIEIIKDYQNIERVISGVKN